MNPANGEAPSPPNAEFAGCCCCGDFPNKDALCEKGALLTGAPKAPGTFSNFCGAVPKDSCCAAKSTSDGAGAPKKPDGFGLFTNVGAEDRLNMDILALLVPLLSALEW